MKIQKYTISEHTQGDSLAIRYVECEFADSASSEYVRIRIGVDPEGHPRLAECLLEALRRVRGVITPEIQRLGDPVTRGY
jgi:hypothetical protein